MPFAAKRLTCQLVITLLFVVGISGHFGCSKNDRPQAYPVTGTITLKGQPVDGATIIFVPGAEGGQSAAAVSDAQGNFAMTTYVNGDGALPGQYRVKILKYQTPKSDPSGKNLTYEEEQAAPDYDPSVRPSPPLKNLLPKKYESDTSSGITHTVPAGPSTLDIKLE